jgi:manganese/zinc/iron transport system permease protein
VTELLPPGGWIILTGALTAISCALIGSFLVLRRMAMLGDAISHAVLPGIVLAFLWTGSRSSPAILLGAGTLGVLTAVFTEFLHKTGRLQADASIGVTFTSLFALGVILVSALAGQVDLDQDCVLYGEIAYVPWDTLTWRGMDLGPRAVWTLGGLTVLMLTFVLAGWSRLKLISFDPALAASLGVSVGLWHYLLMGAVSMTTVASFEIVGAILVVAMLVAPAATAYLLTDRLAVMLGLAAGFGVLSSALGYALATALNASIAGSMGVVAGVMYGLALVFAPRHGILARRRALRRGELEDMAGLAPAAGVAPGGGASGNGLAMLLVAGTGLAGAALLADARPAAAYSLFDPKPRADMRELSTDRPDLTESPYTVDAGHFQLEADAFVWSREEEGDLEVTTTTIAALNGKVGLTDRVDFQVGLPLRVMETVSYPGEPDLDRDGVGDLTFRLKWNAWGNDGGPTAFALMPFVTLATATNGVGVPDPVFGLIAPLAVELPRGWALGTMFELDSVSDGEDRGFEFVTTATVGRDISSRVGLFAEYYGRVIAEGGGYGLSLLDAGLTVAASRDVQFDAGVRLGLTDSADDVAVFAGFAVRR